MLGKKVVDKEKLIDNYVANRTRENRNLVIEAFAPLVKVVAARMYQHLGGVVPYDELCSFGVFGLIDATERFDKSLNVKFETYAGQKIRFAILDNIRNQDWIPRSIRQKQRLYDEAVKKIEKKTGKKAQANEIREELGLSEEEFLDLESLIDTNLVSSLDAYLEVGDESAIKSGVANFESPEEHMDKEDLKNELKLALDTLTENEKKVVLLYYYEEMSFIEIAEVINVTQSRVSQIHSNALKKLKVKMSNYFGMFAMAV